MGLGDLRVGVVGLVCSVGPDGLFDLVGSVGLDGLYDLDCLEDVVDLEVIGRDDIS